jgi:hypothetical protein
MKTWVPVGHHYSPITAPEEVLRRSRIIFDRSSKLVPGVDLRESRQLSVLSEIEQFYDEIPFAPQKREGLRYHFENEFYSYSDAIFLYGMIRRSNPRRIIEVGSGYSSCVMLDTNDLNFAGSIDCTFIDPFPHVLRTLLSPPDLARCLIAKPVQDIPLDRFEALEAGDILFIDSTHVSKTGSDVNHLVFQVLPCLKSGVLVHFHDVFFPFEYPEDWVYEGRAWNESYLLRAFLQYNDEFQLECMNTFLAAFHTERLQRTMPGCLTNTGGSLWLRRR